MDSFKLYSQNDILALVNHRDGEEKLGQKVHVINRLADLKKSTAKFVIIGIPEDIGVRANFGIGGAKTAWPSALKALLNIQSNPFLKGDEVMVLGYFEIHEPEDQHFQSLRNKTNEIDALVYPIVQEIVAAGKIPIIIGGGHNNAAPILTGTSIALNQKINVINIDAHADLRSITEGRHSGNGFSFALNRGYLNQYRVFGLHQNYINKDFPNYLKNNSNVKVTYFEDLLQSQNSVTENWKAFTNDLPSPCGLEIDLDSIENILSSAVTPAGFSLNEIRKLLLSNEKIYTYLHICEGAMAMADGRTSNTIGKAIAYLITDFIKALLPRISQKL